MIVNYNPVSFNGLFSKKTPQELLDKYIKLVHETYNHEPLLAAANHRKFESIKEEAIKRLEDEIAKAPRLYEQQAFDRAIKAIKNPKY
ncbi:MAG: hypothetical protein A2287_06185 [Candidatus Melainabacteria bacterium RIFOXYA12_FULL_32_12]|nr:MAG: hypothetical protein A2287_06185 [Candidatus Melainabacteria bacterium RIFOXYA12_FULL_32_12]